MLERLDEIDWNALGAPQIPALLRVIQSENIDTLIEAHNQLAEIITPEHVLEGCGNRSEGLVTMMQGDIPLLVTPFLIELLQHETDPVKKIGLLELLNNLCRYDLLKSWIIDSSPNRILYEKWARRISDLIRQDIPAYKKLLDDEYFMVRETAQDVLIILKRLDS